jgi:hypothetical protein
LEVRPPLLINSFAEIIMMHFCQIEHYPSIEAIADEARQLVERGVISRQQPISCFCQHLLPRQRLEVELELEENGFLLRDRIQELIGNEEWTSD